MNVGKKIRFIDLCYLKSFLYFTVYYTEQEHMGVIMSHTQLFVTFGGHELLKNLPKMLTCLLVPESTTSLNRNNL